MKAAPAIISNSITNNGGGRIRARTSAPEHKSNNAKVRGYPCQGSVKPTAGFTLDQVYASCHCGGLSPWYLRVISATPAATFRPFCPSTDTG